MLFNHSCLTSGSSTFHRSWLCKFHCIRVIWIFSSLFHFVVVDIHLKSNFVSKLIVWSDFTVTELAAELPCVFLYSEHWMYGDSVAVEQDSVAAEQRPASCRANQHRYFQQTWDCLIVESRNRPWEGCHGFGLHKCRLYIRGAVLHREPMSIYWLLFWTHAMANKEIVFDDPSLN